MKTVKRGSEVKRMSEAEAAKAVKAGWAYCPKSEWKALRTRSANAAAEARANMQCDPSTVKRYEKERRRLQATRETRKYWETIP